MSKLRAFLAGGWRRPEVLLFVMAGAVPLSFATWSALLNNFAIERAAFDGADMGILQSLREVPGFLAFAVVFVLLIMREQTLAIVSLLLLGIGTAMVYPTLLASIADIAHPSWRGSAVGVYRLWRDSGYAVGALMAGILADLFGMRTAIMAVAVLTGLSGLVVARRMPETLQRTNDV